MLTRQKFLIALTTTVVFVGSHATTVTDSSIEVFKDPHCGCCEKWIDHLRSNGFKVSVKDVSNINEVRHKLGMPEKFSSCHTAKIGNYLIEGHVPASDIRRLILEKPKALGPAVPGMPPGSPGMESSNPVSFNTLLVQTDATSRVFSKH